MDPKRDQVGRRWLRADSAAKTFSADGVERIPELDGVRGLAVVAIVIFHGSPQRLPGGWAAVDLFFVLSGFLITSIIIKHGGAPGFLKAFYVRRGLRILPIYYLAVLAVAGVRLLIPRRIRWAGLPYTLTCTQFIALRAFKDMPEYCPYLCHTWTLAIEEQFYLIWPLALIALGRRRVIPLAFACI
ncbi:MAG: acyltransferase [Isosphaeraceae bacterium]|nr:acyltransferase [Isosphaeraceae bacterium]